MLKPQVARRVPRRALTALLAVVAALSMLVVVSVGSLAVGPEQRASAATASSCIVTPTDFANAFIAALTVPDTAQNVFAIVGWEHKEGGNWRNTARFNPLNTTYKFATSVPYTPNWRTYNSTAVQAYTNWGAGLEATVLTITNGYYSNILAALRAGTSDVAVSQAVGHSPWGTGTFTAFLGETYDPLPPSWESTGCETFDTSGDAWVPDAATHTTDFCRAVGSGPNWVASYLACTPYTGTTYDTTVTSPIQDWGYARDRAWLQVNGDPYFCRLGGPGPNLVRSYLECTGFEGTHFGPTVTSDLVDWGWTTGAQWVSANGTAYYCRLVGPGPNWVGSALACNSFNGTSFGPTVSSGIVDWGYARDRSWVPVPGGIDYCRLGGPGPNLVGSYLECTEFDGTHFGPMAVSAVADWGWLTGSQWVPTSLGADYCRKVGGGPDWVASYLACTSFNGTAFAPTVTSGIADWGYSSGWSWVSAGSGADYCRRVGAGPDLVGSAIECTPFDGSSFGTPIASGVVDWGYPQAGARWVDPTTNLIDYCVWANSDPNDMSCTSFNGSSFATTKTSLPLRWGYFTGPVTPGT